MDTRSFLRGLLFCFLAIFLALAGGHFGVWQMGDHLVFRSLYLPQAPAPVAGIHLIDLDYPDELKKHDQPQRFRETLGSALTQLAALPSPPRVVLIDMWISSNPAGAEAVIAGIAALHAKGAKVCAAVSLKDQAGNVTADFMNSHHEQIYTSALDGYGHTQLDYAFGVLKYERELVLPTPGGEIRIAGLPVSASIECEPVKTRPASLVIPLGPDEAFKLVTHHLANAAGRFDPSIPPDAKLTHAIIGSLKEDTNKLIDSPGPLLVAWALSDLLAGKESVALEPLNHPLALLGLSVLAALLAIAAFELLFPIWRPRVAAPRWHALSSWLALAAFLVSTAILLCAGGIVLLDGHVIPVAFPTVCAALGSAFAWTGAGRWIADEQVKRDLDRSGEQRKMQYDVFVSYAHDPPENQAWVKREIVAPLKALRHADGRPYEIFFDEDAIQVGTQWSNRINLALLGSRCFLPVYSEGYFERPYCDEEINIADQLRVEKKLRMFPVARTLAGVPEIFLRKVQYIDADKKPDFMRELIVQITAACEPARA